jgi:hypothetical protein
VAVQQPLHDGCSDEEVRLVSRVVYNMDETAAVLHQLL